MKLSSAKRYFRLSLLLLPLLLLAAGVFFPQALLMAWFGPQLSAEVDAAKDPPLSPAVQALADALKDKDADVRKNAAVSLGRIGKEARGAVPALTAALKDDDVNVRGASATALGRIGKDAASAADGLAELLTDKTSSG